MVFQDNVFLGKEENASILYHDIFDYSLSSKEVIKWRVGEKGTPLFKKLKEVSNINEYYFLKGRESLLYKKSLRERISARKINIAKKGALLISKISTVTGVFVTGALSMNNAKEESDIDLMVVAKENRLWTTRILAYLLLKAVNFQIRKPGEKNEKDKLCLNIWLDETYLSWNIRDRNIYSAHEIAQVIPLINKRNIYQRLLQKNNWILNYWPNSVRIENRKDKKNEKKDLKRPDFIEKFCFWIQYQYMKKRITKEKITLHKAIFHPRDWGRDILKRLSIDSG